MLKHLKFVLFLTGIAVTVSVTRGDQGENTEENKKLPAEITYNNGQPAHSLKLPISEKRKTSPTESLVQIAERLRQQREKREALNESGGGKDMVEVEVCCGVMKSDDCTIMTAASTRCYGIQTSNWYQKSTLPPNYIPSPKHVASETNDVTNTEISSPVSVEPISENHKDEGLVSGIIDEHKHGSPTVTEENEAKLGENISGTIGEHHNHGTPAVIEAKGTDPQQPIENEV